MRNDENKAGDIISNLAMKYVVVTGGVVSGLGKGITSSSIGVLLKASGLNVTCIKIDPYLNIDAGTMSPYEHGEVFVLEDGGEVDLDLGNYERFLDVTLQKDHNITTGKIYQQVLDKERKGEYLGKTVQVVPHITNTIIDWITKMAHVPVDVNSATPDVCVIELGGTVGDIESMVYLEALRHLRYKVGKENFCLVHVSLVPVVSAVGEPKTKPTQHGVRELMRAFLEPDVLVCRSSKPLARDVLNKIALSCMIHIDHVLGVHNVSNIYQVPLLLLEQRLPSLILRSLCINKSSVDRLPLWSKFAHQAEIASSIIKIGFVGKYTGMSDSYLSVSHAINHAAMALDCKAEILWIESSSLEAHASSEEAKKAWKTLQSVDGILVPGGFGDRGVSGKILAVEFARVHKVPFLGICLGLQVAVIEFARTVCQLTNAHSTEFCPDTEHPVVIFMPEGDTQLKGGTMRLGSRDTWINAQSIAGQAYKELEEIVATTTADCAPESLVNCRSCKITDSVKDQSNIIRMPECCQTASTAAVHILARERHRHRYEVNPKYVPALEAAGLLFSGVDTDGTRMEIIELPSSKHPFFMALQAHPEFKSRPMKPSPPFFAFVKAIRTSKKLNNI